MTDAAPRRSAPVARIDHRALRANAEALGIRSVDGVVDLRHDAWGHGVIAVARTLTRAGATALLVDTDATSPLSEVVPDAHVTDEGRSSTDTASLYGLPGTGLAPVMRLSGSVLSVKALLSGEGVSYGYSHRAARDTRVALVTGGYAQGVVRALGDHVSVRIGGARHPVVGRVAMDVCVVDIGEAHVQRGDEAVFFGGDPGDPSLRDWAVHSGLTAAELVTAVGLRAQREHIR